VAQEVLYGAGVDAVVHEFVAAAVAQHVGMDARVLSFVIRITF
jgi:hypothetical protein